MATAYCVKPVGNIATYPGYTTTTPSTVFPKPTPEPTTVPPPVVTPPLSAKAPGTVDGCLHYMNAFDEALAAFFDLAVVNSCDVWAAQADVTIEDLLAWNPSLSAANCVLQSGKSYCILKCMSCSVSLIPPRSSTPSQVCHGGRYTEFHQLTQHSSEERGLVLRRLDTHNVTATKQHVRGAAPPAQTQPGTISSCKTWHTVVDGDGCWAIANAAGISLENFYSWNPGVGSDCSGLWLGYAVCIGI